MGRTCLRFGFFRDRRVRTTFAFAAGGGDPPVAGAVVGAASPARAPSPPASLPAAEELGGPQVAAGRAECWGAPRSASAATATVGALVESRPTAPQAQRSRRPSRSPSWIPSQSTRSHAPHAYVSGPPPTNSGPPAGLGPDGSASGQAPSTGSSRRTRRATLGKGPIGADHSGATARPSAASPQPASSGQRGIATAPCYLATAISPTRDVGARSPGDRASRRDGGVTPFAVPCWSVSGFARRFSPWTRWCRAPPGRSG